MRTVDLIQKKRDGEPLTSAEIEHIVERYTSDELPDYQMAALLMAIYLRGMSAEETSALTMAMAHSGDMIDLSAIAGTKVDKHSTGGVGDKTTLIVGPLAASVGVPVAKMSGRGLGHTGGTIDKLQAIPGMQVELSRERFIRHVNELNIALVGQTGDLVPADKKLYALRDVTATVSSIPLIASSIMSKKIASGADAIVLDVKFGAGAFMKTFADAKQLAQTMVDIGNHLERKTIAVISNMDEPLGYEVGNANEVVEAVKVLQGNGEQRLTELCLTLATYMCIAAGKYADYDEAYEQLSKQLNSGAALRTFASFIAAQGGDVAFIEEASALGQAAKQREVRATESGYVHALHAEKVGYAAMLLGAGRQTLTDEIDYHAGVTLRKKVGDEVKAGEVIAVLHSERSESANGMSRSEKSAMSTSERLLLEAMVIRAEKPEIAPIVQEVII